ncbi:MAG: hypothetical protein QG658_102 [Patescibacteria group bacterium]|nr:hypothetical protein [Patescibacteria group bacterium]
MPNVMQPQNHEHKYRVLAVVLGLAAAVFVGLITFTLLSKKAADDKKKADSQSAVADVVGAGELQGNEQRGKGKIESECYSFEVPRSVSLGVNQYCAVDLGYGSGEGNLLVVKPTAMALNEKGELSFERSLEGYKKNLQNTGVTIESEESLKLDGQDAARLTTVQGSEKKILIFAQTSNADHLDSAGQTVQGVEVSTPNNTKEQSEVMAGVIQTWKWR